MTDQLTLTTPPDKPGPPPADIPADETPLQGIHRVCRDLEQLNTPTHHNAIHDATDQIRAYAALIELAATIATDLLQDELDRQDNT